MSSVEWRVGSASISDARLSSGPIASPAPNVRMTARRSRFSRERIAAHGTNIREHMSAAMRASRPHPPYARVDRDSALCEQFSSMTVMRGSSARSPSDLAQDKPGSRDCATPNRHASLPEDVDYLKPARPDRPLFQLVFSNLKTWPSLAHPASASHLASALATRSSPAAIIARCLRSPHPARRSRPGARR